MRFPRSGGKHLRRRIWATSGWRVSHSCFPVSIVLTLRFRFSVSGSFVFRSSASGFSPFGLYVLGHFVIGCFVFGYLIIPFPIFGGLHSWSSICRYFTMSISQYIILVLVHVPAFRCTAFQCFSICIALYFNISCFNINIFQNIAIRGFLYIYSIYLSSIQ